MTIEEDLRALGAVLVARAADEPDPVTRFRRLTADLTECDVLVSRIADQRAVCAADLHAAGASFQDIADRLSAPGRAITRGRAQQLVERGRPVRAARAARRATQ